MKTVTRQYHSDDDPYVDVTASIARFNVVLLSGTTAWADGTTKQITPAWDAGFNYCVYDPTTGNDVCGNGYYGSQIESDEYDYGPGAHGNLLRKILTQYQWQNSSTYLTANMLSSPLP
jgi:hypothetical protein